MLSKDEKAQIVAIKKLIRSRDFNRISQGIDLVRSVENPEVFNELLGNVQYNFDQWSGSFSHDWKGTGPDEHYFQTAILGLLNYSPQGSKGFEIREQVTILRIRGEITSGYNNVNSKIFAKYLSNFSNLEFLRLERFEEIVGLEEIYHLPIKGLELKWADTLPYPTESWGFKEIRTLHLTMPKEQSLSSIDFVSGLSSLENLKIEGNYGTCSPDFSVEALKNLLNLKYLKTSWLGYRDTNDFRTLKQLNYIVLREENLDDINGLSGLNNLEYVDLYSCSALMDISPLSELKNIRLINLSYTKITSLKGLECLLNLHAINISNTPIRNLDFLKNSVNLYAINANACKELNSIEGLNNSLDLKEVLLEDCTSLSSLSGLEKCEQLSTICVSKSSVENLDPLINCKKLFNNRSIKWDEEVVEWKGETGNQNNPFNGITEVVHEVGYGNLYQAKYINSEYKEYYPDRDWNAPTLNEFIIRDCPNLNSVEGLKNSAIQILVVNNCPRLINIKYLSDFALLQCCDFSSCENVESVKSLAKLNLLDRLILKKCSKVRPKPRFLVMDSLEKVSNYLGKFKESESPIQLTTEERDVIGKLENLLLADNYKNIELGLELAYSISDPLIFDFLLDGVKFLNNKLIPNNRFLGNKTTKEYRDFALEGLISLAPDSCEMAQRVKNACFEKVISGSEITSLLPISGLSELEKLTIKNTSISKISDLSRLKKLKTVIIDSNPEIRTLSGMSGFECLENLVIKNCPNIIDISFICGFKKLVNIQINRCGILSTKGLSDLPKLKNINLNDNNFLEVMDELADLNSLEVVSLSRCENLKSIQPLTQLKKLSYLKLESHNLENLEDVSGLIKPLLEGLRK